MIIACDFDGVAHDIKNPVPGRRMGPPIPGAKEALDRLASQGHEIIIHTVRQGKYVQDWLDYYQIPGTHWEEVGKPQADVYLDDKAIRFLDWSQAVIDIERLT